MYTNSIFASFGFLVLKMLGNYDLLSRKDTLRYVVLIAIVLRRTKMYIFPATSIDLMLDVPYAIHHNDRLTGGLVLVLG